MSLHGDLEFIARTDMCLVGAFPEDIVVRRLGQDGLLRAEASSCLLVKVRVACYLCG